jgi:predicted DNA-binding transcriptional regulator YafY
LPQELRGALEGSALLVGQGGPAPTDAIEPDLLRKAIGAERKLRLAYRDAAGALSQRVVWPFALAFFERSRVLMCWCELRGDFRNFRTDRIDTAELLESRYPKRRQALLKAWRNSERAARGAILPETDRVGS